MPLNGGEGGIRTPGELSPTPDFESGTFDHSDTSPKNKNLLRLKFFILQQKKSVRYIDSPLGLAFGQIRTVSPLRGDCLAIILSRAPLSRPLAIDHSGTSP